MRISAYARFLFGPFPSIGSEGLATQQLVFPVALVVATVVVFRTMNRNREIVALESLGVRYRDLLPPLVMTVIFAGIPFILISTEIAPKGMRAHYTKFSELKGSSHSDVGQMKKEKIWC